MMVHNRYQLTLPFQQHFFFARPKSETHKRTLCDDGTRERELYERNVTACKRIEATSTHAHIRAHSGIFVLIQL